MHDYLSIGSSPFDEPCAQVGEPDYQAKAFNAEERAYAMRCEDKVPATWEG